MVLGLADVEPVVEYAGASSLVSVDGRGAPLPAARAGYFAVVQFDGDTVWRSTTDIFLADVCDRLSLFGNDPAMTGDPVAPRVGHEVQSIAIGEAARVLAVAKPLGDGVACLAAGCRQLLGIHGPLEADVKPDDLALGDRVKTYPKEQAAFEDHRGLRLAARQPVQFISQDKIDLAPLDRRQHRLHPGTQRDDGAGDCFVGVRAHLGPALLPDEGAHILVLHCDRHSFLLVGRVACVDCDSHNS
nr:hypothetical protein [Sphingomonas oligophenolica]